MFRNRLVSSAGIRQVYPIVEVLLFLCFFLMFICADCSSSALPNVDHRDGASISAEASTRRRPRRNEENLLNSSFIFFCVSICVDSCDLLFLNSMTG